MNFKKICFNIAMIILGACYSIGIVNADQAIDKYTFENLSQKQRFEHLTEQLRCVVCQNQTLADSDSSLASDLRNEIVEQIKSGKSDKEIFDFMVTRYGDFVLFNPPVKSSTWLLWYGPFILLGLVFLIWFVLVSRSREKGTQ